MHRKRFNLQLFAAEAGTILSEDLRKVRDVDFVLQFQAGIQTLQQMLGTTRRQEKRPGEVLRVLKVEGGLVNDGLNEEGAIIPLSHYETEWEQIGDIDLRSWRKRVTAKAIAEKGYNQAVRETDAQMVRDIQKAIRAKFVANLAMGETTVSEANLQRTMAQTWGRLKNLYEDTAVSVVHFINPMTIADYLGDARGLEVNPGSFGFTYIENFLGMGRTILAADIPEGVVYSTAMENIVLYFINVANADLNMAFSFTTDETGLIGIGNETQLGSLSFDTVTASGVGLFAEKLTGIVVGTITGA